MTIRGERRKGEILVTVDGAPLDWRSSLAVRNHAPTGRGVTAARVRPSLVLAILLAGDRRGDGSEMTYNAAADRLSVTAPSA